MRSFVYLCRYSAKVLLDVEGEVSKHRKNQVHKVLGRCLNEQGQLSQFIIVSRQFNYNIDFVLLQSIF